MQRVFEAQLHHHLFLCLSSCYTVLAPAGGGELCLVLYLHLGLSERIPESAPGNHGACGAPRVAEGA